MKKKIVPFVIGVLVGAIVATSAFLIYNLATGSSNNSGIPEDRNFNFRGEIPEMPDDENFNGERPELPENMKERFNKRGSNNNNKQEQ